MLNRFDKLKNQNEDLVTHYKTRQYELNGQKILMDRLKLDIRNYTRKITTLKEEKNERETILQ
jgi:hypothetical protein